MPAHRMKNNKKHRVPLSKRTLKILSELEHIKTDKFIGAVLDNAKMCYEGWHEKEQIKLV